jgi:hypothetical protein
MTSNIKQEASQFHLEGRVYVEDFGMVKGFAKDYCIL